MQTSDDLATLREQLADLETEIDATATATLDHWRPWLERPEFAASARNLAHFLALRRGDRIDLQRRLRQHGLSTLGRSEANVLPTVQAVRATIDGLSPSAAIIGAMDAGRARLKQQTEALLGPPSTGRATRILVTLSPETALNPRHMNEIVHSGADAVRINCAHDDADAWRAMAAAARDAADAAGKEVRVLMDLAGPKVRTDEVVAKGKSRLDIGDVLLVRRTEGDRAFGPARVSCTCSLPTVLDQVEVGATAAIDDGKFWARIEQVDAQGLWLRIERTRPGGARLREDKGLNFPDTALVIDPLTPADLAALPVVAEIADIVGYSFVQHAADMNVLATALAEQPVREAPVGIVAKIETELAFRNLPEIIVAAAGRMPFGVMIARGDLGVEVGFPRLSEVQEEILWIAEAAHVPVVWATEVLANLVKNGVTARGEFTDAAAGARAECVMLNKGPFQAEGVRTLDDVLRRQERHFDKKTPQLPPLRSWQQPLA